MTADGSRTEVREQRILDAASDLIVRHGYDKTSMADVAERAGVGRGVLYLHFHSKEELLGALLAREFPLYVEKWLEQMESDPRGGTVGGLFRSVLYAVDSSPLMSAVVRRDKAVFGSYLLNSDNVFAAMQPASMLSQFLRALQEAGAVRDDVDADLIAQILDMLGFGMLNSDKLVTAGTTPSFDAVLGAISAMMDRALEPTNGANAEAGKSVMRRFAAAARAGLGQAGAPKKATAVARAPSEELGPRGVRGDRHD